ncbi:LLM class flavin-dependent oxidoreductase [Deinococcus radiophilus]|uniref:LLM class flavin-dependent oxidoreductase n=2 Tax=Deinococcus radiophilus TaxID=32062 RepID=A0A431VPX8_9DEIO|nr:LLM class flavin-dependent oxidoreductase [Deinococcus radiophilus]RTR25270.1 LLM class flavin-dependent oxidoreductase [Deinococcus radiophilus]UFA51470.1 LLM class flavin-dependent oxidoreductase [Deinococcus radiophilus]
MTAPRLSVLDLIPVSEGMTPAQALEASLALAEVADSAGYLRYWIAEHHNTEAFIGPATEVLIGLAAARTERIRVGSGGVMLPNHSPLKVAENFMTLEALFPGRIDLGLGRAPGTDGRTALALRRSPDAMGADDFETQIAMLKAFAGAAPWPERSLLSTVQSYAGTDLPPLYILGSSLFGAELAGRLGHPYAFAYHFSSFEPEDALATYRQHFRAGSDQAQPYGLLGVNVVAAETTEEAQELALTSAALALSIASGRRGPLLSPENARAWIDDMGVGSQKLLSKAIIGTGEQVYAELSDLASRTGAHELLLTTHVFDPLARQRSYQLIAEAAGLKG